MPSRTKSSLPGPWSVIKRLASKETPVTEAFFQNVRIHIGEGTKIRFWEDTWIGEASLQQTFPTLYKVSTQKKEMISNMGWFEGNTWRWVLSWKRMLNQEELLAEQTLHIIIQQHYPKRYLPDKVEWNQCGNFTVKNLYTEALNQQDSGVTVDRMSCSVWQKLAPPKVELMTWLALLDRLNTKDRLARKKVIPAEMNICTFCNRHTEDIHHLLLLCQVPWSIWQQVAEDKGRMVDPIDNLRNFYANWLSVRIANKTQRNCGSQVFLPQFGVYGCKGMVSFSINSS